MTTEELYNKYVELGRELFNALAPTEQEIEEVNEELLDLGIEDILCDSKNPLRGGDLGLLAACVYEWREVIEEKTDDNTRIV
jgi:hypothetical protein